MLQFVEPPAYTEALPILCQAIATLGDKLSDAESDSYDIDFDTEVNLPSPQAIFARLLGKHVKVLAVVEVMATARSV